MKTAFTLCCLCALPLASQSAPVQTGTRVPSVEIILAAQNQSSYAFSIYNGSGHAITELDVLLVPQGVAKEKNAYVCKGKCSDSPILGNIDHPAIRAGGAQLVKYEIGKIKGGAVIVEAAIFDNQTYAGNEQSAALMFAAQVGTQAGFDRITSAVDSIMDAGYFSGKATQIESTLSSLPMNASSQETSTFGRWFPEIQDCNRHFPKIMEETAAAEKSYAEQSLQPLFHDGNPSEVSLTSWWRVTRRALEKDGCTGCAEKLANPEVVARRRTISFGCSPSQARNRHAQQGDNSPSDAGNDDGDQNDANDANQDNGSDSDADTSASAKVATDDSRAVHKAAKEADPSAPVPTGRPMVKVYPPDHSSTSDSTTSAAGLASDGAENSPPPTLASAEQPADPSSEVTDSTQPAPAPPPKSVLDSLLAGRSLTEVLLVLAIAAVALFIAARAWKTL